MRRGGGVAWALALGICAVAGVLAAPSGARSSHTVRAADSTFSLSVTGPTSLELSRTSAPPRQQFDVTMNYIGPAFQPGDASITATITVQLSQYEMNFGIGCCLPPANCTNFPPSNTPGVTFSCQFTVGPGNGTQWTFPIGVRPTGVAGTGPLTVSLSTGASASVTTRYFYADTTPTTTGTTTDNSFTTTVPSLPTAPPTTVTETFTKDTPPQAESCPVSAATDTVKVGLTWPTPTASFDVTGVAIVRGGKVVARAVQSAAVRRLVVVKTRTPTSLSVTVKNPVSGKLTFKIVARKLQKATRVKATIRQTKRR